MRLHTAELQLFKYRLPLQQRAPGGKAQLKPVYFQRQMRALPDLRLQLNIPGIKGRIVAGPAGLELADLQLHMELLTQPVGDLGTIVGHSRQSQPQPKQHQPEQHRQHQAPPAQVLERRFQHEGCAP